MADTSWNLGAQYDGASGTDANASAVNAGQMALLTNKSGGDLVTGDVVVLDTTTDSSVTTTTTAADLRPVYVVPQNVTGANVAASKTVTADEAGWFYKPGAVVPAANVDGAVDIGEYLTTSTTAKKLTGSGVTIGASTSRPLGACAVALEDATGAGTIKVMLLGVTEAFGIADKTEKTTVAGDDLVVIADSEESNALKKAKLSAIRGLSCCSATRSATQAITGGAHTPIQFNAAAHRDTDDYHSESTNNTNFYAPVDGLYYIHGAATSSVTYTTIAIYKNGDVIDPSRRVTAGNATDYLTISASLELKKNDYVSLVLYNASNANITEAFFSIFLVSGNA